MARVDMMLLAAFLLQSAAASVATTAAEAVPLANDVVHPEVQTALDAHAAQNAAESTVVAANLADRVAKRSVVVAKKTQDALNHAQDVLHQARVSSQVLSPDEHQTLFKAEASLKTVAQTTAGQKPRPDGELSQMQGELRQLSNQLDACRDKSSDKSVEQMDSELRELQEMLKTLEAAEANAPQSNRPGQHSELEIEIQHLRESVERLEKFGKHSVSISEKVEPVPQHGELRYRMKVHKPRARVHLTPLDDVDAAAAPAVVPATGPAMSPTVGQLSGGSSSVPPAPCPPSAIDIDTEMPYGELEPFGREDTAQELTEASIRESDAMVDQVERAEVSEEKRAVFRALTRLRGAAITSFDGVARSQTGNVDEYNKVHKWRMTHPLRHLADEESDISKWAFPSNADF